MNLVNTTVSKIGFPDRSALDCFFIEQNGNLFKATVIYRYWAIDNSSFLCCSPYFYIAVKKNTEKIVASYLERKYRSQLADVQIIGRMDLDKIEHIVGTYSFYYSPDCSPSTYIQLLFHNVSDLMDVRKDIFQFIKANNSQELSRFFLG